MKRHHLVNAIREAQADMFSAPPAQGHSQTSREAAEAAKPDAPRLRTQVLDFIRAHGPVTDEQVQDGLAMNPSTQRPRRVELLRAGLIEEDPVKGETKSKRRASRWRAVPWAAPRCSPGRLMTTPRLEPGGSSPVSNPCEANMNANRAMRWLTEASVFLLLCAILVMAYSRYQEGEVPALMRRPPSSEQWCVSQEREDLPKGWVLWVCGPGAPPWSAR